MARSGLPLFWKFAFAVVTVVMLFGTINVAVVWNHIRSSLRMELDQHALFIARSSAREAEKPILYDDVVALQNIIDDLMHLDTTIAYAFIQTGAGRVLAHSFDHGVPFEVLGANALTREEEISRRLVIPADVSSPQILDVAVPILDISVGVMRIGLREDAIAVSATTLLRFLIAMIALFLILGIIGAFVFAHVITRPITAISAVATNIARSPMETRTFSRINVPSWPRLTQRLHVRWPDELDVLVSNLNAMIERLESTIAQLLRTQASLVQSEKLASVGTLAAGLAHEINNPLAGLQSCVRRIQRFPEQTERNEQYLSLIADSANQIEHVVQGLLDFTRKHGFEVTTINIRTLLDDILHLVSYRIQSLEVEVTQEIETDIPMFPASKNHLQQVILNLIVNGLDAIESRKQMATSHRGCLDIRVEQKNGMVQIAVRDNGTGIPAQIRDNVFDPFFTTKEVGKGTGLGLAVSYNIISEHGGTIFVESEELEYTEFTIVLPSQSLDKHQ